MKKVSRQTGIGMYGFLMFFGGLLGFAVTLMTGKSLAMKYGLNGSVLSTLIILWFVFFLPLTVYMIRRVVYGIDDAASY